MLRLAQKRRTQRNLIFSLFDVDELLVSQPQFSFDYLTMAKHLCHPAPIIRPARLSDHPAMANIFALAFWDEVLFGHIMHPYRQLYPCDFALYALRRVRGKYWDWTHQMLVSTVQDRVSGRETVTGWADWARIGPEGIGRMGLRWWDPRA